MKAFISHIHEESKLALVLKEWVESTFTGQIEVFVSSDIKDIPAGSRWLSEIDSALNSSSLFLMLCSQKSLSRSWINFEAGCAWIKNVPLVPICHSGVKKNTLPNPISSFQAIELEASNFVDDFFQSLKQHFKILKLPRIDKAAMSREINEALRSINSTMSVVTKDQSQNDDGIDEKAKSILKVLANNSGANLTANDLALHLNLHPTECQYYLDALLEQKLLNCLLSVGSPTEYYLSSKGRKYAVENQLLQ